jgi:hypothetical protein
MMAMSGWLVGIENRQGWFNEDFVLWWIWKGIPQRRLTTLTHDIIIQCTSIIIGWPPGDGQGVAQKDGPIM